jgi:putative endonuclease
MTDQRIVYILRSEQDPERHYVGSTADVPTRLGFHNAGLTPYSAKHRPWHLLVAVEFPTEEKAVRFEKYLKSGSGRAFAKRHFG